MRRNIDDKISLLVGLLFVSPEPLSFKKVANRLRLGKDELYDLIEQTKPLLSKVGLGFVLNERKLELVSKENLKEKTCKKRDLLGKSSLEVVSIVCYLEEPTKEEIDLIRGVNSYYVLRDLMVKGLIEKLEMSGKTFFAPTLYLLKKMGLERIEELEGFEKLKNNKDIKQLLNR